MRPFGVLLASLFLTAALVGALPATAGPDRLAVLHAAPAQLGCSLHRVFVPAGNASISAQFSPTHREIAPGETARYKLGITNHGARNVTVCASVANVTREWTGKIDNATLPIDLAPGETVWLPSSLTPPSNATTGTGELVAHVEDSGGKIHLFPRAKAKISGNNATAVAKDRA